MRSRKSLFVFAVLLASVGAAAAQTAQPNQHPVVPAATSGPSDGGGLVAERAGVSPQAVVKPAYKVGWNNVHATNCVTVIKSSKVYVYLYPKEGGYFYTTTALQQPALLAQCAVGNWISFYITSKSGSSFTWNDIESWDYK
jgi:hypothetical protein